MKCSKCNSENGLDYSEFGLPLGHDMRCEDCNHTWKRKYINQAQVDHFEAICDNEDPEPEDYITVSRYLLE